MLYFMVEYHTISQWADYWFGSIVLTILIIMIGAMWWNIIFGDSDVDSED